MSKKIQFSDVLRIYSCREVAAHWGDTKIEGYDCDRGIVLNPSSVRMRILIGSDSYKYLYNCAVSGEQKTLRVKLYDENYFKALGRVVMTGNTVWSLGHPVQEFTILIDKVLEI